MASCGREAQMAKVKLGFKASTVRKWKNQAKRQEIARATTVPPSNRSTSVLEACLREMAAFARIAAIAGRSQSFRKRMKPWKLSSARRMRQKPTQSEAVLRKMLDWRRFEHKVRCQSLMLGYIADFYISDCRLVIEVDGGYHIDRKPYDVRRDRALAMRGFTTLRIPSDVCTHGNAPQIRHAIRQAIAMVKDCVRVQTGRCADQCNDVRPEKGDGAGRGKSAVNNAATVAATVAYSDPGSREYLTRPDWPSPAR